MPRVGEDLDRLVDHLLLLLGGAVGQEAVDVGQQVEGDAVRIEGRLGLGAGRPGARLARRGRRRRACRCPRPTGRCDTTTRSMPAASWRGLRATTIWMVEQLGVAITPLWPAEVVGVDLGHHQRHVGVGAKGARLVDHHGAGGHGLRHELLAHGAAGGEEGEVDAGEGAGGELADRELGAPEGELRAARARAGQQAQLAARESRAPRGWRARCRRPRRWRRRWRPCRRAAHSCTEPPVGVLVGRPRRSSRPKASCSARTASSTRSLAMTQRDLDRRGRDHVEVDAPVGERAEHERRHAGVRAHAGADQAELGHRVVGRRSPWRCSSRDDARRAPRGRPAGRRSARCRRCRCGPARRRSG